MEQYNDAKQELKEKIEEFLKSKSRYINICDEETARNLFGVGNNNKKYALLEKFDCTKLTGDNIQRAMHDSGIECRKDKSIAISLYVKLAGFIKNTSSDIDMEVGFPPIDSENKFGRLLYVAKYFQGENSSVKNLAQKLWVHEKTVRRAIEILQGKKEWLQVCGKKFIINDMETNRHGGYSFASTPHPLFLAENLCQIMTLLKGMRALQAQDMYRERSRRIADEIWRQLSPYGRKRLLFVSKQIFNEEHQWLLSLDNDVRTSMYDNHTSIFANEVEEFSTGPSSLLYYMKTSDILGSFCIEYKTDGGHVFYENCKKPRMLGDDIFQIETNGEVIELSISNIVRCGQNKAAMV